MPWKETCVIEERMKFVTAWKQGGWSMTDLCGEFGISRKTGYKILERYEADGVDGLKDRSRAPRRQRHRTREKLVELILEGRKAHPSWGARKLLAALMGRYPQVRDWPSSATVGRVLKRAGMIPKKRRRRRLPVALFPLSHVMEPNDVWCVDFKGHFVVGNGKRCDPLTISDAFSRFLLECRAVAKTNTRHVQEAFERVFREYGLPTAIRSDNGSPFAAKALAGLSRLSVWWLKLGIHLERIEPGKPYQNGRHERMHRTLKQETALPARSSLQAQQAAFDNFRQEYNFDRPHEALKNRCPTNLYVRSPRIYPEALPEPAYPTNMEIQTVSDMGTIQYGLHRVFLSSALRGELVGIEEISDRHRRIHFACAALGVLDAFTGTMLQYRNPAPIITGSEIPRDEKVLPM